MDTTVRDPSKFVNMCGIMDFMSSAATPVVLDDLEVCCAPATGGVLGDAAAEKLAWVFKALADPARIKLLSLIAAGEGGEACVCDLTAPLGLSQPTVSHHMKLLAAAGLVEREQRGKWAYYRVNDDALDRVARAVAPSRGAPVSP